MALKNSDSNHVNHKGKIQEGEFSCIGFLVKIAIFATFLSFLPVLLPQAVQEYIAPDDVDYEIEEESKFGGSFLGLYDFGNRDAIHENSETFDKNIHKCCYNSLKHI